MYVCMYVSSPEGGDEQRHTYPDRKVPRDKTTFRNDADAIRPERGLQVKERKPAYGMWWWGAIGNLSL